MKKVIVLIMVFVFAFAFLPQASAQFTYIIDTAGSFSSGGNVDDAYFCSKKAKEEINNINYEYDGKNLTYTVDTPKDTFGIHIWSFGTSVALLLQDQRVLFISAMTMSVLDLVTGSLSVDVGGADSIIVYYGGLALTHKGSPHGRLLKEANSGFRFEKPGCTEAVPKIAMFPLAILKPDQKVRLPDGATFTANHGGTFSLCFTPSKGGACCQTVSNVKSNTK